MERLLPEVSIANKPKVMTFKYKKGSTKAHGSIFDCISVIVSGFTRLASRSDMMILQVGVKVQRKQAEPLQLDGKKFLPCPVRVKSKPGIPTPTGTSRLGVGGLVVVANW